MPYGLKLCGLKLCGLKSCGLVSGGRQSSDSLLCRGVVVVVVAGAVDVVVVGGSVVGGSELGGSVVETGPGAATTGGAPADSGSVERVVPCDGHVVDGTSPVLVATSGDVADGVVAGAAGSPGAVDSVVTGTSTTGACVIPSTAMRACSVDWRPCSSVANWATSACSCWASVDCWLTTGTGGAAVAEAADVMPAATPPAARDTNAAFFHTSDLMTDSFLRTPAPDVPKVRALLHSE